MILVDANLLLYAKITDYAQHEGARLWLNSCLTQAPRVGLPWPSLLAFLRIATNPRIFPRPMSIAVAWQQVSEWMERPNVWIPCPGDRHAELLADLLQAANAQANLVPDAHLAALAIEHGLTLCSCDGDFARFPGLRWMNPLRIEPA